MMLEYGGLALAGLIVFLVGLGRMSPIRQGQRTAEIMLAVFSALTFAVVLVSAFDGNGRSVDLAAIGRVSAAYMGAICGYFVYRLYRLRVPAQPERSRLRPGPRLPPGYEAMNRRMDEVIRAIGADIRGGTLSPEKKQAYMKALQENDALLKQYRRSMPPAPAHLPPEYAALSREADQTFQAMKDAVARGEEPSEQDALKLEAFARRMGEHDEAMLLNRQRQGRMVKRVGFALAALFFGYLVILFLNA